MESGGHYHHDQSLIMADSPYLPDHTSWTEGPCPGPCHPLPINTTSLALFLLCIGIGMCVGGIAHGEVGVFLVGVLPLIPGVYQTYVLFGQWRQARRRRQSSLGASGDDYSRVSI